MNEYLSEKHKESGYPGLQNFIRYIKGDHEYSNKNIKDWYDKQTVNQRTRIRQTKRKYNPIVEGLLDGPGNVLYLDSMFFKKHYIALITGRDHFSKLCYIYVKKIKRGGLVNPDSIKASDTLKFVDEIFEKQKYKIIKTDFGNEFKKQFKAKYDDIHFAMLDPFNHTLLSPIESLNRNIRLKFEKYHEANPKDKDYISIFKRIEKQINNTFHNVIKMTPVEAHNTKQKKALINIKKYLTKKPIHTKQKFNVGDRVRLYYPKKGIGGKLKPAWSKTIYTIQGYNPILKRYTFEHTKRLFDVDEIQLINNVQTDTEESEEEEEQQQQRPQRSNRNQRPGRFDDFV